LRLAGEGEGSEWNVLEGKKFCEKKKKKKKRKKEREEREIAFVFYFLFFCIKQYLD
jgi:antirestriction protein ArdC